MAPLGASLAELYLVLVTNSYIVILYFTVVYVQYDKDDQLEINMVGKNIETVP